MGKRSDRRCSLLLLLLIALSCSLGSVWAYNRWFALKIVAVDLQGFSKAQTELVLQGKLDKEGIARNFDAFQASYEALPANVVPITNDVILGGKVETINRIKPKKRDRPSKRAVAIFIVCFVGGYFIVNFVMGHIAWSVTASLDHRLFYLSNPEEIRDPQREAYVLFEHDNPWKCVFR